MREGTREEREGRWRKLKRKTGERRCNKRRALKMERGKGNLRRGEEGQHKKSE